MTSPSVPNIPPVLWLGFRPFFLLGALLAVIWVPLWVFVLGGFVPAADYMNPMLWHAHEMVFGFTLAIIGGFLLTAICNWTKLPTCHGKALLGLVVLWIVGRVAVLAGAGLPTGVAAAIDVAFLPALAFFVGRPLFKAKNRRNIAFPFMMLAFAGANLVTHLDAMGVAPGWGFPAIYFALDIIIIIMLLIGGRVVPLFTKNAIGDPTIEKSPRLDQLSTWGMAALVIVSLFGRAWTLTAILAIAVGVVSLLRMRNWGTLKTLRVPILWVLHVGYGWIGVGLIARGLSTIWPTFPLSVATHIITAGAIGTLTLGMMARVSLGHTGRPLQVKPAVAFSFVLMVLATLVRVAAPFLPAAAYIGTLTASALLWSTAFGIYLAVYVPILISPRADGRCDIPGYRADPKRIPLRIA